jgi:hypothetical protein
VNTPAGAAPGHWRPTAEREELLATARPGGCTPDKDDEAIRKPEHAGAGFGSVPGHSLHLGSGASHRGLADQPPELSAAGSASAIEAGEQPRTACELQMRLHWPPAAAAGSQ